MKHRRERVLDGKWTRVIYPVMRDKQPYRMACCDCGLVHDIEFWIEDDTVAMRVSRNNRSTAAVRRHMKTEEEKKE